jgi:hypothetical protein
MTTTKKTDIKLVRRRATIIFTTIIVFFIISVFTLYAIGKTNKKIQKTYFEPVVQWFNLLKKQITAEEKSTTNSLKKEDILPLPTRLPSSSTEFYKQPIYVYPTLPPPPTIEPGKPGSEEWDKEFWRKWNEMGKKNAEMQQKVEESQKKFCQENPNLCH